MAQNVGSIICALVVIVHVLDLHLCIGRKVPELCSETLLELNRFCNHNQSGLCGVNSKSCSHQLHQVKLTSNMTAAECQMEYIGEASGCGSLQPGKVYTHEKPLVRLRLYHYNTWLGQQSAVNFTFPSPDWSSLKFQYKVNASQKGSSCRQFNLYGVSLPLKDTLFYDCVMFRVPGNVAKDAEVTFENDKGEGRTFIFRIPSHLRINPLNTSLSEWHVFFYLHQDFIATSSHLPVTVQSAAPFGELSYKVSIVKCLDTKTPDCGNYSILNSTLIAFHTKDEWTVHLPIWSNPGSYAVTVQIVSDHCPSQTGCHVSVSPKFEIKPSLLGIWISIGMGSFLISFLTFLLVFNYRLRTTRKILLALQNVQPTVLLVYLAESQPYMEFINIFAEFLKNTCHLVPYLVDWDVGIQDPNCWTRDHIIRADKIVFIVPGNPEGESITPIRNQWIVALNYLSGHQFTTRQMTRKVAAVILPSSGSIPCEILHVCRFKLVDQVAALVTWLHSGTWLDKIFLWQPTIRSSSRERVGHTWSETREAALRTSFLSGSILERHSGISLMYGNVLLTSTIDQTTALRDDVSVHSNDEDSTTDGDSEVSDSVFDPDIPSINDLERERRDSKLSVSSQDTDELLTDSGDDDGIFT